jgi:outer membrane protein assembly factor BamB
MISPRAACDTSHRFKRHRALSRRKRMPNRTVVLGLFFLVIPAFSSARADDWPQFRGPTGQGVSAATGVPLRWGHDKNVAWKVPVPGRGWSSPVLAGGKVYLTTGVSERGGAVSLRALCLDAGEGNVLWNAEVLRHEAAAAKGMHQKNSPASATPVVTKGRLYVHFGHLGTAALDLTGRVLWRQTALKYPPVHGNGGSPLLVDEAGRELLVFSCDGAKDPFLAALDAAAGDVRWKTPRNSPAKSQFSFSTPLAIEVHGKTQVVCPTSGLVAAYDPSDGRELWRVRYGEGYSVVPRPAYSKETRLLYVSSGFDSAVLYAIKPQGAAGDATASNVAWTIRKGAPNTPSPLVAGEELYMVADGGVATCADARTGQVRWTHRLGGAGFSASPVFAEGRVYFQNEAGVGFVVKAGKQFELLAENDLGERSLASYAVADDALFIRTEKHLWKIRG